MAKETKNLEHYFAETPKSMPRYGLIRTYLRGRSFTFLTASGVFSRERVDLGTRLLIESMLLPDRGYVLDMGCGYGAIGIAAAVLNPRLYVILVDVNARAVRLARQNLQKNCVGNAEVRKGRFYTPVREVKFDSVFMNPPISAGMETVKKMILEAPQHMIPHSVFQIVVKSKVGSKRLPNILEEAFGNVEVLARKSGYRVLMSEN